MSMDISLEQLTEFYTINHPDLKCITDINRRHFRFLLPTGRFLKIKDTIHASKDLQKWFLRLHPLDVYYSTSTYLDPTSVSPRPTKDDQYWGPGNIILHHDIAFDIDRAPLSLLNLERARKDAVKLLDFLKKKNYPLKYIVFSGSKGFHVVFDDVENELEPNLRLREKSIIQKRKKLVHEILNQGIVIDASVTVDTRRIIRLPGTINSKTGFCCQYLSEDQIRSPVVDWIDYISHLRNHMTIPRFKWKVSFIQKRKKRKRKTIQDSQYGYTTFISSSVLGTKGRHAVLLSFPFGSQKKVIHQLQKAQELYHLTDIYLFKLPESYQAICLKTVQRNRYQKILDFTASSSSNQLKKYKRVSLRMGPLVNSEMQMIEPSAEFITILECPMNVRNTNYVSQGHIQFLKKHGLTPLSYQKIHGAKGFKIIDAEIKL